MTTVRRISPGRACGILIDVQEFFLAQLERRERADIVAHTAELAALFDHLKIPAIVTLEQPVARKGRLPQAIARRLGRRAKSFEKNFFDLTREPKIRRHLARLGRKQAIVAGCETDVCVLQSCLGLLALGHEVYVVEDLLFSSTAAVKSALARMRAEGAVFLTFKTLFYELVQSVDGSERVDAAIETAAIDGR